MADPVGESPRMKKIVVSLLKGGVAKSETSVHLAHGLALAGYKVLLVDTDVQAQCSDMLGVEPENGLAEVIAGWADPQDAVYEARPNLWLLAGGVKLAAVKMEIARREMAPEAVLAEAIDRYEGHFDIMVMDTAPGWDTLLVNALYCCEDVLSPVSMEPMALKGLERFEERLDIVRKYKPSLRLRWVAPTFVDGRVKKSRQIMKQLEEQYGDRLTPPIKYSAKLSETTAFGLTIYESDPKSPGAKGYRQLTEKVIADCFGEERRVAEPQVRDIAAEAAEAAKQVSAPVPEPIAEPVMEPVVARQPEPELEPLAAMEQAPEPIVEPAPEPVPPERPSLGARRHALRMRLAGVAPEQPPQANQLPENRAISGAAGRIRHALRDRLARAAVGGPMTKDRVLQAIDGMEMLEDLNPAVRERLINHIVERYTDVGA